MHGKSLKLSSLLGDTMKATLKNPKFWFLAIAVLFVLMCIPPGLNLVLISASRNGQLSKVNRLLALGVAPSDDALDAAAYHGQTSVVRSLLVAGANPNAENDIYETALAHACENGHIEIVKLMLAYGADPNWGCREMDPLTCARMGNYPEIVKLLKQAGAKE